MYIHTCTHTHIYIHISNIIRSEHLAISPSRSFDESHSKGKSPYINLKQTHHREVLLCKLWICIKGVVPEGAYTGVQMFIRRARAQPSTSFPPSLLFPHQVCHCFISCVRPWLRVKIQPRGV